MRYSLAELVFQCPWPLLNKECQQLVDNTWKLPWSRRQQKTNYIGESEKLLGAREI